LKALTLCEIRPQNGHACHSEDVKIQKKTLRKTRTMLGKNKREKELNS